MPLVSTRFCKSCQIKTAVEIHFEHDDLSCLENYRPQCNSAVKTNLKGTECLQAVDPVSNGTGTVERILNVLQEVFFLEL